MLEQPDLFAALVSQVNIVNYEGRAGKRGPPFKYLLLSNSSYDPNFAGDLDHAGIYDTGFTPAMPQSSQLSPAPTPEPSRASSQYVSRELLWHSPRMIRVRPARIR